MYSKELQEFCKKIKPIKLSVTKVPEELEYKDQLLETTSFLNSYKKVPLSLRYYCVLNSINSLLLTNQVIIMLILIKNFSSIEQISQKRNYYNN